MVSTEEEMHELPPTAGMNTRLHGSSDLEIPGVPVRTAQRLPIYCTNTQWAGRRFRTRTPSSSTDTVDTSTRNYIYSSEHMLIHGVVALVQWAQRSREKKSDDREWKKKWNVNE